MTLRTSLPFQADHVGGKITEGELRSFEDDAIRAVVWMQADVGLRSATDGEFCRPSWSPRR